MLDSTPRDSALTTDSNKREQTERNEVARLWQQVFCQVPAGGESSEERFASFEDYTREEDTEPTCSATLTEDVVLNAAHVNEHGEDDGDEPARASSFSEVFSAINVRNFVEAQDARSDMMAFVANLERTMMHDAHFVHGRRR